MTDLSRVDKFEALEGSMEQLNIKTSLEVASYNGDDDDDDDDEVWGEDETFSDAKNAGSVHSAMLDKEWKRRQEQFHTMGYREGIAAGKEASAQEGFNVGFKQSVLHGHKWGLVRGVSSAYTNLPPHLKDKLAGTSEKRDRLQDLYQSSQMISSTDALKMFYESIQHIDISKKSSDGENAKQSQLESLSDDLVSLLRDSEVKIQHVPDTSKQLS